MTDNDIAARQLAALYADGYSLETFERYPKAIGISRGNCLVLVENTETGLRMIGRPGWKMGGLMGVLVERDGRQVFQYKEEMIEATDERLDELQKFTAYVEVILHGGEHEQQYLNFFGKRTSN